jgi:hypothetical protein
MSKKHRDVRLRITLDLDAILGPGVEIKDFLDLVEYEFGNAGYGVGCGVNEKIVAWEVIHDKERIEPENEHEN